MRIQLLVLLSLLSFTNLINARPFNLEYEYRAFRARGDAKQITTKALKSYELVLTSDSLAGRETTKPGMWKAAHYLANHLEAAGASPLESAPGFLNQYPVRVKNITQTPVLELSTESDTLRLSDSEQFRFLPMWIDSETKGTDTLLFVGYGINADSLGYNDFSNISVKNKILVFFSNEPVDSLGVSRITGQSKSPYGSGRAKRNRMRELGAKGTIEILQADTAQTFTEQTEWLTRFAKRDQMSLPVDSAITPFLSFTVSWAAIDSFLMSHRVNLSEIKRKIDGTLKPHSFIMSQRAFYDIHVVTKIDTAVNVIGVIPGNDPSRAHEAVMITAHFDHLGEHDGKIYRGADDNASGTSVVMALASAFSKAGPGPRTQIFLFFSGEEKGLLGSKYYSDHPLWPLADVVAEVNVDMVGRNAPDSIFVIGSDMLSHDLDAVVHTAARWTKGIHLNLRYNAKDDPNRFYYRSDHYSLAKHDIPSVFYFSGIHDDYHQVTDTMDKLDFEKMERVSRMIYLATRTLNAMKNRPSLYTTDAEVH